MSEWIYRNAIVAGLEILRDAHKEDSDDTYSKGCQACIDVVKCAPTYDVVEVKHGHWEFIGGYGYQYRCSKCFMCAPHQTNYCPICGAKMDEVSE